MRSKFIQNYILHTHTNFLGRDVKPFNNSFFSKLTLSSTFGTHSRHIWNKLGAVWGTPCTFGTFGPCLVSFGSRLGCILGAFWSHLRHTWGKFCAHHHICYFVKVSSAYCMLLISLSHILSTFARQLHNCTILCMAI